MNKVVAVVTSIEDLEIVTYLTLRAGETSIKVIQPQKPNWLNVHDKVYFKFQEFSVCIGKSCDGKVSIENRIPAVLTSIRAKSSLSVSKFDTDIGEIVSLMPQSAFEELEIVQGDEVMILVSEMDIELEPYIDPMLLAKVMEPRTKIAC
ncbi:MAG TPA: hypothetical protein ENK98_10090 [Epsilonproteobacteria bacterium]|nr:hypothetical protein [Campylobacterota bacterium]